MVKNTGTSKRMVTRAAAKRQAPRSHAVPNNAYTVRKMETRQAARAKKSAAAAAASSSTIKPKSKHSFISSSRNEPDQEVADASSSTAKPKSKHSFIAASRIEPAPEVDDASIHSLPEDWMKHAAPTEPCEDEDVDTRGPGPWVDKYILNSEFANKYFKEPARPERPMGSKKHIHEKPKSKKKFKHQHRNRFPAYPSRQPPALRVLGTIIDAQPKKKTTVPLRQDFESMNPDSKSVDSDTEFINRIMDFQSTDLAIFPGMQGRNFSNPTPFEARMAQRQWHSGKMLFTQYEEFTEAEA